jgi:uncharacterized protein DUF326
MTYAQALLPRNASPTMLHQTILADCIRACVDCAQACGACADACLSEPDIAMLRRCIRLDLDCADVCEATGRIVSRQTAFDSDLARAQLHACATACRVCGDECARHAQHGMEHCRIGADACRRCEQACSALLAQLLVA